jgi:hypothetical protein
MEKDYEKILTPLALYLEPLTFFYFKRIGHSRDGFFPDLIGFP